MIINKYDYFKIPVTDTKFGKTRENLYELCEISAAEFSVQQFWFLLKIKLFYFTLLDLLRARLTRSDHSTQTQDAIFAFDVF